MKYAVTAQAFNRATAKPAGVSRTEVVDSRANVLFTRCTSFIEVKDAYEAFWNKLNPNSEAVVFVSQVIPCK